MIVGHRYHHAMQHDDRSTPVSTASGMSEWTSRFVILGQTHDGRTFRPSDWAERLAGVMASFRPQKAGSQQHLTWSPYVLPSAWRGIRCVVVDPRLRDIEPMAFSFMLNFAQDNQLRTVLLEPGDELGPVRPDPARPEAVRPDPTPPDLARPGPISPD